MRTVQGWLPLSRRRFLAGVGACLALPSARSAEVGGALAADDASPPVAISIPKDDAPHGTLTEWWYYTGHLKTDDESLYGFEQVCFEGRRGALAGVVSHVAITDTRRQRFRYDQRRVLGKVPTAKSKAGFDFVIGDWSMRGVEGVDELKAALSGYSYSFSLTSRKPAVLHGGDGYVRTGSGAVSYYYSRTRMSVAGTLEIDGAESSVTGEAWMDHQWGDFTNLSTGGWDWFSLQLDDDTEVMIYRFRDAEDAPSEIVATYVRADGSAVDVAATEVLIEVDDTWTSPHSAATYPSAWGLELPGQNMTLKLIPTMPDQELDTRETTGLTYWEGQVAVTGSRAGTPVAGKGYVELTGYTRRRDGVVP
jgi:predicted secreted hydrolase